jgi:hypothetical protein
MNHMNCVRALAKQRKHLKPMKKVSVEEIFNFRTAAYVHVTPCTMTHPESACVLYMRLDVYVDFGPLQFSYKSSWIFEIANIAP